MWGPFGRGIANYETNNLAGDYVNLDGFINSNHLPAEYADSAERCYLPFADWVEEQISARQGETYVLGINGAQGTGKSTLARLISEYLSSTYQRRVAILSIDDLYLTLAERESLAQQVHPMLRTRGVPGTHDVSLGRSIIEQLKALRPDQAVSIPRFDKSRDDRCEATDWSSVSGPVDLLIFEGWCIASRAQLDADLQEPVNDLEATADEDGRWRKYVNDQLRDNYAQLYSVLDSLLFLQAPSFDAILGWRIEQEHRLRDSAAADADAVMSDAEVADFIQYYERVTLHNFNVLPTLAGATIKLGLDHQAVSLEFAKAPGFG